MIIDDAVVETICERFESDLALTKAVDTRIGNDHGVCVEINQDGTIHRCSFNVTSPHLQAGCLRLSPQTVTEWTSKKKEQHRDEQLATLIGERATGGLASYLLNPTTSTTPTLSTLDTYDLRARTEITKRKGKLGKTAISNPKKLRDEVESLRRMQAADSSHFPEVLDVEFFSAEPSYQMRDYREQGYQPFDEMI